MNRRADNYKKENLAAQRALRLVDAGLFGILFVAPLFFGGMNDLGRFVFVSLVAVTAIAWALHRALLPSPPFTSHPCGLSVAYGVLLLAIGLLTLQLFSLPPEWVARLSPRTAQLLSLWGGPDGEMGHLGRWTQLSLLPHATTKALAMLVSYSLLFVVVVQRLREVTDINRLLQWIGISTALMACFALLQYYASNGSYYWFYEHAYRSTNTHLTGSFLGRNQFAGYLVLGVAPLVGWWVKLERARTQSVHHRAATGKAKITMLLVGLALTIVMMAILRTLSRGGALSMLLALTVVLVIYFRGRILNRKYLFGLLGLAAVVIGLLSLNGFEEVSQRLNDFTEGSVEVMDHDEGRRKIWSANLAAIRVGGWTGSGAGSHHAIYGVYLPESLPKEYTYAENGYLQVLTETGLAGGLLLAIGLSLVGYWAIVCWRNLQKEQHLLCFGAATAGLAASALHSLVDFVWYVPACMGTTVILAASMLRLSQMALPEREPSKEVRTHPRFSWVPMTAVTMLLGVGAMHTFAGPAIASMHWNRYLIASKENTRVAKQQFHGLLSDRKVADAGTQEVLTDSMVRHLQQVIAWCPQSGRAHLRLAGTIITQFEQQQQASENPMNLTQIRGAALASQFTSSEELRTWLLQAFGENSTKLYQALDHADQALVLCPLQGEGYLFLADLCFLRGERVKISQAYIQQGLRVSPYDGDVLFEVGKQKMIAGQVEEAMEHWAQCYRDKGPHQMKIVYLLAGRVPAALFLDSFQPDWHTLRAVWRRYQQHGQPEDGPLLLSYAVKTTERQTAKKGGLPPFLIWLWQGAMYAEMDQPDEAMACYERAYQCRPRQYGVRLQLGRALLQAERFAEAESHLRWCLARRPDNRWLRQSLVLVAKGRLAKQDQKRASRPSGLGRLNR